MDCPEQTVFTHLGTSHTANRSFCLLENTALTARPEGPFPPHSPLTWVLYLEGLSAGPPAEPFLHEATRLRSQGGAPHGSPGVPSCATPCGTRTPASRTRCPTGLGFLPKFILPRKNRAPETTLLGMKDGERCLRGVYTCTWDRAAEGGNGGAERRCRARGQEPAHAVSDTEEAEIPKSKALPTQAPLRN